MFYEVEFNWSHATVYAEDRGLYIHFDHGVEAIRKLNGETAAQAIKRVYPKVSVHAV